MINEKNSNIDELMEKYIKELYAYHNKSHNSNLQYKKQPIVAPVMAEEIPVNSAVTNKRSETLIDDSTIFNINSQDPAAMENLMPKEKYNIYKQQNSSTGFLKVQTLTARRTYPVPGAKVTISKRFPDKSEYIIATGITDESGLIPTVELPTKPEFESEAPGEKFPFTTYSVSIEHPDFLPMTYYNVPVFADIVSTQTADMVLKAAALPGQTRIDVLEQEPQDLN